MTEKLSAAQRLAARLTRLSTERLIEIHGKTLNSYYTVPLDKAEPFMIVVDAIAEELVRRGVAMTNCCYCPEGHHDSRTCDLIAPNPLIEAADLIMEGIPHVR